MINKIKLIINSILIFFILQTNVIASEKISIIYVVENIPITNVAINNEIKFLLLINQKLSEISKKDMVQYASKSIIKEKIKEIEIKKYYKLGTSNQLINRNINQLMKKLGISDGDEFNNLISKIGLNKEFINKKIEIEILWNQLIYQFYNDKIIIDENKLKNNLKKKISKKINSLKQYLLYEILFSTNTIKEFENEYDKIKKSINEIGFESTANIFSNSKSAMYGGKIGWVNENQLSKIIIDNINKLNLGEYSNPINVPNGKMILMIKDKREIKNNLSLEEELKKSIVNETNKQYTQYSTIYFKKIELDTKVYEK